MREKQHELSDNRMRVYQSANRLEMITADVHTIQENEVTVTIMHSRNMIVITDAIGSDKRQTRFDKFTAHNDSMLEAASLISCKKLSSKIQEIVLKPDSNAHKTVNRLTLSINRKNEQLLNIKTEYEPSAKIDFIEYQINEICSDCHKEGFFTSALDRIFQPDGTPKPEFTNYRITDVRANN